MVLGYTIFSPGFHSVFQHVSVLNNKQLTLLWHCLLYFGINFIMYLDHIWLRLVPVLSHCTLAACLSHGLILSLSQAVKVAGIAPLCLAPEQWAYGERRAGMRACWGCRMREIKQATFQFCWGVSKAKHNSDQFFFVVCCGQNISKGSYP